MSNMYQDAINSQCACNLSGLFYSLPKIADQIWAEIRAENNGASNTVAFREHPVARLLAEQIAYLTGGTDWSKAMEICERKAKEIKGGAHEAAG